MTGQMVKDDKKSILREDYGLSDEAREALDKARKTPKRDYVEL